MSNKKVSFSTKSTIKPEVGPSPDQWVDTRESGSEKELMKRLTIDIPESLHRVIKMGCASRGTKIGQEITTLLKIHYCKILKS